MALIAENLTIERRGEKKPVKIQILPQVYSADCSGSRLKLILSNFKFHFNHVI